MTSSVTQDDGDLESELAGLLEEEEGVVEQPPTKKPTVSAIDMLQNMFISTADESTTIE